MEFPVMNFPLPQHPYDPASAEETVALLTATVRDALMHRHAFQEQLATEWASAIVDALRQSHGGQDIYLKAPGKEQRDEAIRREIRPGNAEHLARKHNVSVASVYRIAGRRL